MNKFRSNGINVVILNIIKVRFNELMKSLLIQRKPKFHAAK